MLPQVREQSSLNINQCSFSETFHLWMRMWRRRARGGRGWRTIAALAEQVNELPNPMLIWSKHIFWVREGGWKVIFLQFFSFINANIPALILTNGSIVGSSAVMLVGQRRYPDLAAAAEMSQWIDTNLCGGLRGHDQTRFLLLLPLHLSTTFPRRQLDHSALPLWSRFRWAGFQFSFKPKALFFRQRSAGKSSALYHQCSEETLTKSNVEVNLDRTKWVVVRGM